MPSGQTILISQCQDDEPWTIYEVFILWHDTVTWFSHNVIILVNVGLQGTTCITKSSSSLGHEVFKKQRPQASAESFYGFVPTTVLEEVFDTLSALMLKTLKLLMISLLRSHHCLNSHLWRASLTPLCLSLYAGGCWQQGRCEDSKFWIFGADCCWWLSDYWSRADNGARRCSQLGCGDTISDQGHVPALFLLALPLLSTQSLWGKTFLFFSFLLFFFLNVVIAVFSTAETQSQMGTPMSLQSKHKITSKNNFHPIFW